MRGRVLVGAIVLDAIAVTQHGVAGAAVAPEHGYVTDTMQLPTTNTQAGRLGRDVDGNGTRDNRLGQFYATLFNFGLDMGSVQNAAIRNGEIVMLHSLRTSTLANTKNATWQVLSGQPTAAPDFTGSGTFAVGGPRSSPLAATIKDHDVSTASGAMPVRLQAEGPVTLQMAKGRVFATCIQWSCSKGRINGAVSKAQINNILVPELAAVFSLWIQRDCPMGAGSCAADSQGKTVVGLFDADMSGTITEQEIRTNPLVGSFLKPDLDLTAPKGKDAVSFGFGFTAVRAQLAR